MTINLMYYLTKPTYRQEPQLVELVDVVDPQDTSLIYRLDRNNIYVKSKDYAHTPFPTKFFNDDNSYTQTAGYVNPSDVALSLLNYDRYTNTRSCVCRHIYLDS